MIFLGYDFYKADSFPCNEKTLSISFSIQTTPYNPIPIIVMGISKFSVFNQSFFSNFIQHISLIEPISQRDDDPQARSKKLLEFALTIYDSFHSRDSSNRISNHTLGYFWSTSWLTQPGQPLPCRTQSKIGRKAILFLFRFNNKHGQDDNFIYWNSQLKSCFQSPSKFRTLLHTLLDNPSRTAIASLSTADSTSLSA